MESGQFLPFGNGSYGSFFTGQGHPVRWSNPMQTTGQVECKWVVKSMQFRNCTGGELDSQVCLTVVDAPSLSDDQCFDLSTRFARLLRSLRSGLHRRVEILASYGKNDP
jgi:hypothetical protein